MASITLYAYSKHFSMAVLCWVLIETENMANLLFSPITLLS